MKNEEQQLSLNRENLKNIGMQISEKVPSGFVSKVGKFALLGVAAIAAFEFLPGAMVLATNILLGGILLTTLGGGILLWRNKDVRRALKMWIKVTGKNIAENYLHVEPLKMAEIILETKKDQYKNIEQNTNTLYGILAGINEKLKGNKEKRERSMGYIQEAQKKNNLKIIDNYAIEIAESLETDEFLTQNKIKVEAALANLEDVKEAAKYKMDRTTSQFEHMKQRRDIVVPVHEALVSANNILNGDDNSQDLERSLDEFKQDMAGKIAEISRFSTSTSSFVEKTKIEKESQTRMALNVVSEFIENQKLLEAKKPDVQNAVFTDSK